ncbi:MAG: baseplate J/gp47 family protein, partial [Draconibacterium sp.]|nr:baseplate J/gp47 family protein [Draconibacterium sp.]
MANCGKDILIAREGTEQQRRFIDALSPEYFKLNEFSLNDWMQFAYNFARQVNYFGTTDSENKSGNWQDFFNTDKNLQDFLKAFDADTETILPESKNITPHLALFISFLTLLKISQKRFNNLTKKHLDFYYSQILNIQKLPATPDKVHVIFELAKNILDTKIDQNTELDGGKDESGKKRLYKTTEELVTNQIKVSQLKSVYNDHEHSKIKAAEVANSLDGTGTAFPEGEEKWWPFGYSEDKVEFEKAGKELTFPPLKDARLGFAVSGEILELQEGERNIQISVEFDSALNPAVLDSLRTNLEIYCSGEKKWLGPFQLNDKEDKAIFKSGLESSNKILKLAFQVPREEKPIVGYNATVLGENFNTGFPVCRILIKTQNIEGHALYRNLVEKQIKTISVNVDVKGVKSLLLESDIGTLNAAKPFYPFSTLPVKNSKFYINYPELFKKDWTNIDVDIDWKNTPDNFKDLYYAYRESYRYKVTPSVFISKMGEFNVIEAKLIDKIQPVEAIKANVLADAIAQSTTKVFNLIEKDLIVESDSYFKADVEIKHKEEWETATSKLTLFTKNVDVYQTSFSVTNSGYLADKNGPVRLSLNQSFLHELFPRIYALAFSSEEKGSLIPNEPYTPMVETISLDYSAKTSAILGTTEKDYNDNQLFLFHEHPFGQSEEHPYLKSNADFLTSINLNLVPTYCKGGELYIGLEKVKNLQQVSLLVQVLEGSENTLKDSFTGNQKVEWSVLCSNEWKSLDSNYMVSNDTDNFLKSGIVKFAVPKEATDDNSILSEKLVWIRAKIHKDFDAVCKTIAILAQAVLSEFSDNGNDLLHLQNGLEAKTISKLVQRVSTVKGVSQPFSSFGGVQVESDEAYYRRISERLRHKNRAITLWDYENIILQQFPEIYKVKCLNHSSETSFLSPGKVLLVVIPDIINKNVFDIFQPRVSKATLNKIQEHVNLLNTLHVNAKVINPDYEEVKVDLKVKFHKGFDENYYQRVLNEDIKRFLSPWAYGVPGSIRFGTTLHRSFIINYIEKLEYVDYVEDVKLIKGAELSFTSVTPSSPKACGTEIIFVNNGNRKVRSNCIGWW